MKTLAVLVSIIATVSSGVVDPTTTKAPLTPEQIAVNALCSTCNEDCLVPYDPDCHYFVNCKLDATGNFHGEKMICPLTTYADTDGKCKATVSCPNNNCQNEAAGTTVAYDDTFCATYLECDGDGNEVPKCCESGYAYSSTENGCVVSPFCNKCELHNSNDTCVYSASNDDGVCNSYSLCLKSMKFPACCPDGKVYSPDEDECVADETCTDSCPDGYLTNECDVSGNSYPTTPAYCGTYMTCNGTTPSEYRCCVPGYAFSAETQKCEATSAVDCNTECPPDAYKDECPLVGVPNKPNYFKQKDGTGEEQECAPGSLFSDPKCGCAVSVAGAEDNSCSMDMILDMTIPIKVGGSGKPYVQVDGTASDGADFNGKQTTDFSSYVLTVAYFQSQLDAFYISVTFMLEQAPGIDNKMVLVSNCIFSTDNPNPSFEVCIEGDKIYLTGFVVDENGTEQEFKKEVGYQLNVWNNFEGAFDGLNLWVKNQAGGGEAAKDSMSLPGKIPQASTATTIGACKADGRQTNQFTGSIAQVQFTKCVKTAWVEDMA